MTEKRFKNRIFAGMLALVLIFCASCGAQGNPAQNNAANNANNAANSGNSARPGNVTDADKVADYAARDNNLVFEHEYDNVPLTISGLKDEAV